MALSPLVTGVRFHWEWAILIIGLAGVTLFCPAWLAPLNRLWQAFGKIVHACVSTVVLFLLYFLIFTPGGWVLRLCGHNAIARTFDATTSSYWNEHQAEQSTHFTRPY